MARVGNEGGGEAANDLELMFHERGAWCDEVSPGMWYQYAIPILHLKPLKKVTRHVRGSP